MKVRLIIAGGRDFKHDDLLERECDAFLVELIRNVPRSSIECITGGADGADMLGERYAILRGFNKKEYKANWDLHDRAAGPIRNTDMAVYAADKLFLSAGNKAALIAFWNGKSPGTKNMIETAQKYRIQTKIVLY